jgi:hypothetical protein
MDAPSDQLATDCACSGTGAKGPRTTNTKKTIKNAGVFDVESGRKLWRIADLLAQEKQA